MEKLTFIKKTQGSWSRIQILEAENSRDFDFFSETPALNNETLVVSSKKENKEKELHVYSNNNDNWTYQGGIPTLLDSAGFGSDVVLQDSFLYVGCSLRDTLGLNDCGSVLLYKKDKNHQFHFVKEFVSPKPTEGSGFGWNIEVNDDYVVISELEGALDINHYNYEPNSGVAHVYRRHHDGTIELIESITANDVIENDRFGYSITLNHNEIIISSSNKYNSLGEGPIDGARALYSFLITEKIYGKLFFDLDGDCQQESGETGVKGRVIKINPGEQFATTKSSGVFFVENLKEGEYEIEIDTSGFWRRSCEGTIKFTVDSNNSIQNLPLIPLVNLQKCTKPNVSVHMPIIRRCFSNQSIYINAANGHSATLPIVDPFLVVEIDPLIQLNSASHNYIIEEGGVRIDLDTLVPGEFERIILSTTVSCDANWEQTLCVRADLFPIDSCVLDTTVEEFLEIVKQCNSSEWDGSDIILKSICTGDSIKFLVINKGKGEMECFSPMKFYIDGELFFTDSIKLRVFEKREFSFSADGRTWRLEVPQHPHFPGKSFPSTTIEACGNIENWKSKLVQILPLNDKDPIRDIYCGEVTGSYDPNDKTGYPYGLGEKNEILPNTDLEYLIRFQNTGNDTAFTVVIRDTLSSYFNIYSLVSGVSSHDYEFEIYGDRILKWTFNNIMLPDSTTYEPGSNGFVKFKVEQVNDLPDGAELNNRVGIYFDFNEPIITNTTSHIVQRSFLEKKWNVKDTIVLNSCENGMPSAHNYNKPGTYFLRTNDTLKIIDVENLLINDSIALKGEVLVSFELGANYQWFNCEANEFVLDEKESEFKPTENGEYQVIINHKGCLDSSLCYSVFNVGEPELLSNIQVYPNPSNNNVFVINESGHLTIDILNVHGQLMLSNLIISRGTTEITLPKDKGIYFLKLSSEEATQLIKVIKR